MPVVDALNSLSNWSETQTSKVVHGLHREIAPMLLKLSGTTPTTSELLNKIIRAGLISPSWVPSGCMDVARFNCSRNDSTVLDYITISSMTTTPDQCTAEIFFVESSVRYIEEKTQRTSHMMKLNPTPYPHEQEGYSFRSFSPSSKWNIFYCLVCRKRGALHTTFSHPVPGCSLLCPLYRQLPHHASLVLLLFETRCSMHVGTNLWRCITKLSFWTGICESIWLISRR